MTPLYQRARDFRLAHMVLRNAHSLRFAKLPSAQEIEDAIQVTKPTGRTLLLFDLCWIGVTLIIPAMILWLLATLELVGWQANLLSIALLALWIIWIGVSRDIFDHIFESAVGACRRDVEDARNLARYFAQLAESSGDEPS